MGQKLGLCPFFGAGAELGPHLAQFCLGRGLSPYQVASSSIQPFGHNRHGPKIGALPLLGRRTGSPCNTMSPGSRPTFLPSGILIHPAIWPQQIWAEQIVRGSCALLGWGAVSPSNTVWPGPRTTCMPSVILIHLTISPQYTNVIDRQDRTQRQTAVR